MGTNWNWNGGALKTSSTALKDAGIDLNALKCLTKYAQSSDDGNYKVIVMTSGGTFTQSSFRPTDWQPSNDNGKTLVIFNTVEDVILQQDGWRQFGLSVLAPFSKVSTNNPGFVGGFIVAKEFSDTTPADYLGNFFSGVVKCGPQAPSVPSAATTAPTLVPTTTPTQNPIVAPTNAPLSTPTLPLSPSTMTSYSCAIPPPTLNYAVVTSGNATISAHTVYRAVHVAGTLIDGTSSSDTVISSNYQNQPSWMGKLASPVKPSQGATLEIKGGYTVGGLGVLDYATYEWLAQHAQSSTSGGYKVVVMTSGGTFNTYNFRNGGQGSDNGNTLVIFNTPDAVILDKTSDGRQFGPSVLAPFSKVTLKGDAGFVDGFVIAKEFTNDGNNGSALQMHANGYTGPLTCV